jgi:hypothetical protein
MFNGVEAEAAAFRKARGGDALTRAIAAGKREAEEQRQAKAMLDGKSVSGRDRARLKR